ncbi:serine/threonine-protein kinase psk1-like [Rana temporaria]|uniref:serine/threonine-protein kinase psk1-like n=1 Tax=Rana temporaria TaxID=8407 RepID=UPI001AAD8B98|nr:serine/threonine-protein kinase psk1-like [Rana temporaria]
MLLLLFSSQTCPDPSLSLIFLQIFNKQPFDKDVDYFALGVTLFEAAFGTYPFDKNNPRGSISCESPYYPVGAECVLVDFLNKLLCKDQKKRKAYIANIRKHRLFRGINWEQLEAGETPAPFSACRKNLVEEMTKTTIDLYGGLNYNCFGEREQALFLGFSFISDEWKAIQKLKTKNTR